MELSNNVLIQALREKYDSMGYLTKISCVGDNPVLVVTGAEYYAMCNVVKHFTLCKDIDKKYVLLPNVQIRSRDYLSLYFE